MEKFQLSVGLNNGWLCNTVAEIPVDPVQKKKQTAARNFHFKQIRNDSSGSRGRDTHFASCVRGQCLYIFYLFMWYLTQM